jgi:hypothetical protein
VAVPEVEVDGGGEDQRQGHRNHDAPDYRDGKRLQHLRPLAQSHRQRKHSRNCGQRRHQDWAQAAPTGLIHCLFQRYSAYAELLICIEE